jgi:hypothetical protein
VTAFETARTVRYVGQDADEVRRAFAADSERALAAGYVITRSRWDTSAGPPALVVDYLHASMDRPSTARGPGGASAAAQVPPSSRGGLGEAMLIAGVILAVIVALAVTIPTAPPAAAPTPAPAAVVVESPVAAASNAAQPIPSPVISSGPSVPPTGG